MWLKWNRHDLSAYIVVIEREGDGEGEVEGDTHRERLQNIALTATKDN